MPTGNYKNILAGKEKIFKTADVRNMAKELTKKNYIGLGRFSEFETPEQRLHNRHYVDPLSLNFKLLFDFDSVIGLFAEETNKNSALAYLKRIGEDDRFDMLKHWITEFKKFVQEYDFLILECVGLDTIISWKQHEFFTEENTIELKIRETSDMRIQALITTYRHIWFDEKRCVEVIPSNLRKFNMNIIVFSSGYYNMFFYDDLENEKNIDKENQGPDAKIIFPTVRKLADNKTFNNPLHDKFNHLLVSLESCHINNESGKSFLETLTNEPNGDFIKNNLVLNYKFATHKGRFNNIMGDFDFVDLLVMMSVQNKAITSTNNSITPNTNNSNTTTNQTTNNSKLVTALKTMGTSVKKNTINKLKTKANNIIPKLTSRNSVIGDLVGKMTPAFAEQMIQNTINLGIDYIEKKAITDPIARVNNMLFQNFSNNLIDIYKNNFDKNSSNKIELIQNPIKTSDSGNKPINPNLGTAETQNNITYGVDNVYNRSGF